MKHTKKYQQFNESQNVWKDGFENTKLFVYNIKGNGKVYLKGCRHCDEVVPLDNVYKERQMVGNVYQSLCNCSICGRGVVLDEHNYDTLKWFLANKDEYIKQHENSLRTGILIKITTKMAEGDKNGIKLPKKKIGQKKFNRYFTKDVIKVPKEDIFVLQSDTWNKYDDTPIDKLYVYTATFKSDDLHDNPFPNGYFDVKPIWYIILEVEDGKSSIFSPYPYDGKKYPKAVDAIFQKYLKN